MTGKILILSGLLLCGTAVGAPAEPAKPVEADAKKSAAPEVTVTGNEIKLPGITINRETLEVRVEATAVLESGILEYVVCLPDTHEHEAIFVTKVKPEMLHAALLLAGLKPMAQIPGLNELWFEKAPKQWASRVKMEAEWEVGGVMQRVNVTSMLRNREMQKMDPDEAILAEEEGRAVGVQDIWVFSGSYMETLRERNERIYAANRDGILVAIWANRSTVIQYGVENGNPYKGDDLGIEINEGFVPKEGTKVNLVFSRQLPPDDSLQGGPPVSQPDR